MYYTEEDLRSVGLYWFAVDKTNHVAVFNSDCSNSVPPRLLQQTNSILNLYFSYIVEKRCGAVKLKKCSNRDNNDSTTAKDFAERGLYVYDRGDDSYFMLGRPKLPIAIDELPEFIRAIITSTALDVSFVDHREIKDIAVLGNENRIVPEISHREIQQDWIDNNTLWEKFIAAFSLRFEKSKTRGVYELENFSEFCPDCYEKHGNYVELDSEMTSQSDSVEYWEMNRYSLTQKWICRICGFDTIQKTEFPASVNALTNKMPTWLFVIWLLLG